MTDIKGSDIITADPKDQAFDPNQKKIKRRRDPEKAAMKAEKAKLKAEQREKLAKAKLEYAKQKGLAKQSINVYKVSLKNQKEALNKQLDAKALSKADAKVKYRLFKIDAKAKLQTELNDIFRLTPEELKKTFSFKFQK
ncbi:hypothetical protein FACS1894166_06280 [Bacilli bacterium]|nr:hypothetical protein FACS1894166_06280 [Bacilli bacterium]